MLQRVLDDSYPSQIREGITTLTIARIWANACYRFAAPFLATIARGVHTSLADLGVAVAISELSGFATPFTARLVDRLPRRSVLLGGLLGIATAVTVAAASRGIVLLGIALVVLSQSKATFDLGMGSWIADHVEYERRGRVVGITETSWALGLVIGVSIMGLVTAAANWRVGYVTGAVAVLVMATLVRRRLPSERPPGHHRVDGAALPRGLGLSPAGWWAIGGAMALMAASQCLFVTFGSWLDDSFGFTAAGISAVVFGLGAGELTASITSARRTDVWGKERSVAAGAGVMVPAAIGLSLLHGHLAPSLILLGVAVGAFEFAIVSAIAIGSRLVPGSPTRGLGLLVGAGTLGRSVAAVPATRLYDSHGFAAPTLLTAALASITVVALLISRRLPVQPVR